MIQTQLQRISVLISRSLTQGSAQLRSRVTIGWFTTATTSVLYYLCSKFQSACTHRYNVNMHIQWITECSSTCTYACTVDYRVLIHMYICMYSGLQSAHPHVHMHVQWVTVFTNMYTHVYTCTVSALQSVRPPLLHPVTFKSPFLSLLLQ